VTMVGQMPVSRLSIFVKDGFLAPEIFGVFQVQPGERVSWKRIYIFRREQDGQSGKRKRQDRWFPDLAVPPEF
jgi:hypothetical protein